MARLRELAAELRGFAGTGLGPDDETDRLMLIAALEGLARRVEDVRPFRKNPSECLTIAISGCYLLFCRDEVPQKDRLRALGARLRAIPRLLEQARARLDQPVPQFVELALGDLDGCAAFLREAVPAQAAACPDLAAELLAASAVAMRALEEYREFLRELLPRAASPFAIGAAAYEDLLRKTLLLGWGAEETIAAGRRCLEATEAELEQLAQESGRPWRHVLEECLLEEGAAGPDVVTPYHNELARLREFIIKEGLAPLPPPDTLRVVETPAFERQLVHLAAYLPPPPFEATRLGLFWVTPPGPGAGPGLHNRSSMLVTAIHEAYPGHHVQALAALGQSRPARAVAENIPFIEGWAFYCEELMERAGYITDLGARVWRRRDQLWRAARAVVDPSLHLGRMSLAEAVEFLQRRACLSPSAARAEALHMASEPGQSVCYLMGRLGIDELARAYAKRRGAASLSEFHARLLALGSVPPQLAARLLDAGEA